MKLKQLAALALAFIGLAAPVMGRNAARSYTNNPAQGKEMNRTPEVRLKNRFVVDDIYGGIPMTFIGGGGIDPKTYGQHFVRRGTHKRTNKRK